MRRWTYTGQQVYVGDELQWERATVVHDGGRGTLLVREGGQERLRLTEVAASALERQGRVRRRTFTGLSVNGSVENVVVTIVGTGCACGR